MMKQTKFPPGWDEERVQRVLGHYESQTEEESVAEDEAGNRRVGLGPPKVLDGGLKPTLRV